MTIRTAVSKNAIEKENKPDRLVGQHACSVEHVFKLFETNAIRGDGNRALQLCVELVQRLEVLHESFAQFVLGVYLPGHHKPEHVGNTDLEDVFDGVVDDLEGIVDEKAHRHEGDLEVALALVPHLLQNFRGTQLSWEKRKKGITI